MNYRKIWEQTHGTIPKDENGRTYDIHHIDGNRKNNSVDNLICLSVEDHYKIHLKQFEENKSEKEFRSLVFLSKRINKNVDELTGWTVSQETREKIRKTLTGKKRPPEVVQKTKDGNIIKIWESHHEACKFLNNKNVKNLIKVCNGLNKSYMGYRWEYCE
jgi:hypothetical protein